jgi:hypothetical protein
MGKKELTLATRAFAAATLVVWLAALVCCSAQCLLGSSHCSPGQQPEQADSHHEHDAQAVASHHDHDQVPESDKHGDCPTTVCDSLKNFVYSPGNGFLFKPDFPHAYTLDSASLSQALAIRQPVAAILRPAWRRDWVFTPEVSLGPAFRSHAPPSVS